MPETTTKASASVMRRARALGKFLEVFGDDILLQDIGPKLTCIECEALARLLQVHGLKTQAMLLRKAHAEEDEEGDMESHLRLKLGTAASGAVQCPVGEAGSALRGCGSSNVSGPDEEGFYDCLDCGIWFRP